MSKPNPYLDMNELSYDIDIIRRTLELAHCNLVEMHTVQGIEESISAAIMLVIKGLEATRDRVEDTIIARKIFPKVAV